MRSLLLLLCVAPVARAANDEIFNARLEAFEKARALASAPGGQASVNPAVDALVETGDPRAIGPLASLLRDTIDIERGLFERIRETQKTAARALELAEVAVRELEHLRLKEKAGDPSVGPEIRRREDERSRNEAEFRRLKDQMDQFGRTIDYVRELRERLAKGCIRLLDKREGAEANAAIAALRQALAVTDRDQALHLVRILGDSDLARAEEQLLEILAYPNVDDAVRRRAQMALLPHLTRRGAEALLTLWEREPEGAGRQARHALSLAAQRPLATIEDARAYVASLK